MLRIQRSAKEEIFRKEDVFYGGGAIPPAQINGWECLFWLIRGISQSWHHLVSLLQLTILTGQGHISELRAISCGFQRKANIIARKRKKLVGFHNQVVYISAYWFLPIHLTLNFLLPFYWSKLPASAWMKRHTGSLSSKPKPSPTKTVSYKHYGREGEGGLKFTCTTSMWPFFSTYHPPLALVMTSSWTAHNIYSGTKVTLLIFTQPSHQPDSEFAKGSTHCK